MVNIATGTYPRMRTKRADQLDPATQPSQVPSSVVIFRLLSGVAAGHSLSLTAAAGPLEVTYSLLRFPSRPCRTDGVEREAEFYRLTNWNCIVDIFVCLFALLPLPPPLTSSVAPTSVAQCSAES